jgi:hypothetical protein
VIEVDAALDFEGASLHRAIDDDAAVKIDSMCSNGACDTPK